jgi:hypothetical protein
LTPSPAALSGAPKAPIGGGAAPKIAVALYDYDATNNEELTIRENDNMMVLDDSDSDWWKVRLVKKGGGEGLVPATYVEVNLPSFRNDGCYLTNMFNSLSAPSMRAKMMRVLKRRKPGVKKWRSGIENAHIKREKGSNVSCKGRGRKRKLALGSSV